MGFSSTHTHAPSAGSLRPPWLLARHGHQRGRAAAVATAAGADAVSKGGACASYGLVLCCHHHDHHRGTHQPINTVSFPPKTIHRNQFVR